MHGGMINVEKNQVNFFVLNLSRIMAMSKEDMIAYMQKHRAKKRKFAKIMKNKRKDQIVITRHKTSTRFNNRMLELYKECGVDGHGVYQSDWYNIENVHGDIDAIVNPKAHSCDWINTDDCQHTEYKATDRLELKNTECIDTNWAVVFKHDMDEIDTPVGLSGGVFRLREKGDERLHHIVFFNYNDIDGDNLYNVKDRSNLAKAKENVEFVLDFGEKGGLVKYVNATCVENKVNVKMWRFRNNNQWQVEFFTTKAVKAGEFAFSDYPVCDDIDGVYDDNKNEDKEAQRRRRYKNCKCYKLGIEECINATKKDQNVKQKRNQQKNLKQRRKQQKNKEKVKGKTKRMKLKQKM